jgi:AmmeMemoRadiSam system protein B
MSTRVRFPAVAGQFYPGRAEALAGEVDEYTRESGETSAEKLHALGCIVPHAGYVFSGHVAGAVYRALQLPRRYVILCPNHTGMGEPLAIMSEGEWSTPLGEAPVDTALATALKQLVPQLREDADAHRREHALEVQLPFLQKLRPDFSFVPITVGTSRYDALEALGLAIAELGRQAREDFLIIASSDMNHYESDEITRIKDGRALERVLALDPAGLYEVVTREHISMCGFGPAVAMLTAAKARGATGTKLIKYATSGDINGDRKAVVGYAGVAILG